MLGLVFCGCSSATQPVDDDDSGDFDIAQDALTTRIQAETQVWSASSGDSTTASTSTLRLNANATGDSFKFTTQVASGSYAVTLRFSQRNVYGNYRVDVNGTSVGTFSGYSANTGDTWTTMSLGILTLSGNVEFRFTSIGKNSAASDFDGKLDYIDLTSAGSGSGTGGATSGGSANGGSTNASGGATSGGATSSGASGSYPCDGTTTGYNVLMLKSGSTWTVTAGSNQRYSGSDMQAALSAAYASLTSGRTSKQSILVRGDGDISASAQLAIPSYTILNVCGTINVAGTASGSDRSPIYARGRTDIDIPHLKMTGSPQYGLFFRESNNVHLGQIDLRLTSAAGIGIRVDSGSSAQSTTTFNRNLSIDYVYGSGMGSHVVETYGIDGIKIGTVEGSNVGECGLLFNRSINADVKLVTCNGCGAGTGYAAFRVANSVGKIGSAFPAGNVHVGKVYARGGGRGIFSVSGSGGLTIDQIDIANTGNNPILLQNAYNTTIAAVSGTVVGGLVLLSNDTTNTNNGTFPPSSNVALKNLTLSGGASVRQDWCSQFGANGCTASNITGGSVSMCK